MLDASLSPVRLTDIPGLNEELVYALNILYPEKCPDAGDAERAIWMYAGARELVRKLSAVWQQQRGKALENFDRDVLK